MLEKIVECSVNFPGPASPGHTLSPLRRGGGDPCYRVAADGAIWRTTLMVSGPVTARICRSAPDTVDCEAWGSGATEFADSLPALLGADDDATGFAPEEPTIAAAHRRVPHLRLGRTGRVLEALIPAVIEQRVAGKDAFRAWRLLVTKFGSPAPGPAPAADARARRQPRCGVASRRGSSTAPTSTPAGRARSSAARSAPTRWSGLSAVRTERAREALTSLPGVGVWTAAETAQRAFGDADALSVGDYHLAKVVGWSLLGHPIDDAAMVELLEPMRPHRHRAVRLLEVSGLARNPRFGARQAIPNLRAI